MDRALTKALKCQYWLKRQWHIWQGENLLHKPVIWKLCWRCAALICKIIHVQAMEAKKKKKASNKKRTFPSNRKSNPCWTRLPPLSLTPTQIINLKADIFSLSYSENICRLSQQGCLPGQREQTSPIFISVMLFEGSSAWQKHLLLFPCDCPSRTFYSRLWEGPIQLCGGRPIPFLYCATFTLTGRISDRPGCLSYILLMNGAQARKTQCANGWTGWTVAGIFFSFRRMTSPTLPLLSYLERRRRVKEKDEGSWMCPSRILTTCFPPAALRWPRFLRGISVRVCVKRLDIDWWVARRRYLPPLLCRTVACSSTSHITIVLSPTGLSKAHVRTPTNHATV